MEQEKQTALEAFEDAKLGLTRAIERATEYIQKTVNDVHHFDDNFQYLSTLLGEYQNVQNELKDIIPDKLETNHVYYHILYGKVTVIKSDASGYYLESKRDTGVLLGSKQRILNEKLDDKGFDLHHLRQVMFYHDPIVYLTSLKPKD